MTEKPLQIACIGAGYFSSFHLEAWERITGVAVGSICDQQRIKAQTQATKFGIPRVYDSVERLMDECKPDLIDIITPPESHLALISLLSPYKVPIILQKPVAPTLEDCQKILAISQQEDFPIIIHENFRFQPWYRKIHELIREGLLGDAIHSLYFRMRMGDGWAEHAYLDRQPYFREMKQLLIYETGIHFIDTFRYLLGDIEAVYARLQRLNPHIIGEDMGLVLFEFANGSQAVWDANRYHEVNHPNPRYTFGFMHLEGEKGHLTLDLDGNLMFKPLGNPPIEIPYTHRHRGFAGDCVFAFQSHVVEGLRMNSPIETELKGYMTNILVQEAIYKSSKEQMRVKVAKSKA